MNRLIISAAAMACLIGCAPIQPLPTGCSDDTLLAVPLHATAAERQRIEWQNNDRACKCGLESCPDYALPS